jgi:sugar O-acyltransferase (sialic acid O-acetyltransferase NeuD family)
VLKDKNIYILGYSGHAYVAIEVALANNYTVLGYFDKLEHSQNPFGIRYYGSEDDVGFKNIVKSAYVFPAMGSNEIREKLYKKLKQSKISQLVLKHPSAVVSSTVEVGESTLINPNVSINSLVKIGIGCIINTAATVEHECVIGNFSHIAPGAVLTGNVTIGNNCFVGSNAVIKQGVAITDNVIIGAGAVVLKDITEKGTWVGNPVKLVSNHER